MGASYLEMVSTVPRGSEANLISAAVGGNEAAFNALVGPLIEPGYKLASVMLRDPEEARDAMQEACLIAWRKLFQLRAAAIASRCRTRAAAVCGIVRVTLATTTHASQNSSIGLKPLLANTGNDTTSATQAPRRLPPATVGWLRSRVRQLQPPTAAEPA